MPPNASSCVAARQGSHFFWAEWHAEVAQFVSEVQGDRLREQGVDTGVHQFWSCLATFGWRAINQRQAALCSCGTAR